MNAYADLLKEWLVSIKEDRHWLAGEIGVSKRTLDNWFAAEFPLYAIKSIDRLKHEMNVKSPVVDDHAIQLSIAQWKELCRRAKNAGFKDEMEYVNALIREDLGMEKTPEKMPPLS